MQPDDEATRAPLDEVDLRLSALLDGELDPESAAELRARLIDDPALAERSARLGEVDGQIRRLAARPPDAARLARLRAALQTRLDAETETDAAPAADPIPLTPRATRRRPARRAGLRAVAPYAAALAAGLALYFAGGLLRPEPRLDAPREIAPRIAEVEIPAEPAPELHAGASLDPVAAPTEEPLLASSHDEASDEASDEELAVALQLDVLADLDAIENLELLELLAFLEVPERL